MTERNDRQVSLADTVRAHADAVREQLARITALRAASPDILTPPAGVNPLDLTGLDPLLPMRPEPVEGQTAGPSPSSGHNTVKDPVATTPQDPSRSAEAFKPGR